MNKPHTGGDRPAFHQNQRSHRQPQTSLSSKGTTIPIMVVVARMPSFGDNCSPNCSPPSIVKINNGGGLLILSDPFARIVFICFVSVRSSSVAPKHLILQPNAYQWFTTEEAA